MSEINAANMHFQQLNESIRNLNGRVAIRNCLGQRYIASGLSDKTIEVYGTPGNAMGAYLDGSKITVYGNAQDAVGDTMNDGTIIVHGNVGDALGYAMRGGKIFVKGNAGYRTGIHMKEYKDKKPVIIIGGTAGSFLGEYQAGGTIIVLGLGSTALPVGSFCGTGMHGGKIILRSKANIDNLPEQVTESIATPEDLAEIADVLREYCDCFSLDYDTLIKDTFRVLKPNMKNPYKKLYTYN